MRRPIPNPFTTLPEGAITSLEGQRRYLIDLPNKVTVSIYQQKGRRLYSAFASFHVAWDQRRNQVELENVGRTPQAAFDALSALLRSMAAALEVK